MNATDLSKFDNSGYEIGAGNAKQLAWYACNALVFATPFFISSGLKCKILRLFGAKIGVGVVIKPRVNIKFAWKLVVGDYAWIGEKVWIDNLDMVFIGGNACISQSAMLQTGSHRYDRPHFDLQTFPIHVGVGAWVGAGAIVCPGVQLAEHAVLTAGSVATASLEPYSIYQGNPAIFKRIRKIQ